MVLEAKQSLKLNKNEEKIEQQRIRDLLLEALGGLDAIDTYELFGILRRRSGMPQSALFLRTNINYQYISEFECGHRDFSYNDMYLLVNAMVKKMLPKQREK